MKDDQTAQGFSFQLSASAPPAEVADKAPDSGPSWFASGEERLDLDLDAFAASAPPPATASSSEDVTRTPAPVDATSPPPPVTRTASAESGPAVRRIQFPSRAAASTKPEPARSQKTVFASSVSQAPRARLISDDVPEPPSEREAPRPEPEVKRSKSPSPATRRPATLKPTAPSAAAQGASPALAGARERMLELAANGSALTRQGARTLSRKSALLARRASELGAELLERGKQRLAERSAARAPVARDEASVERDTDALEPEALPVDSAHAKRASSARPQNKQWVSGGAAMVAAVGCYFAASHLLTFAGHGPTTQASVERAEAQVSPEGEGSPAAADADAENADSAANAASVPALSKPVPAEGIANRANGSDDDEPATAPAVNEKDVPVAKTSTTPPALSQLGMPEGLDWPKKGLIEVVTSGAELVYVDGVFTGRGPLRRIPIAPGSHEVVVRTEGQKREMRVDVSVGKRARIVFGA